MTPTTYEQWAGWYSTLFGLHTAADLAMVAEWLSIVREAGYTVAELHAAGRWLAIHAPPAKWDHLGALRSTILMFRQRARDQQEKEKRAREEKEVEAGTVPGLAQTFRAMLKQLGQMPSKEKR